MRGTVSRNLTFKDVFVSDDEQLMPRGIYFKGAQTWPAMFFTLSPTYLGVANAAYDFTVQYLRGEVPGEPPVKRRQFPTKQITVAQMRLQLESMKSLFTRAIFEAKPNPSKDEKLRLYAAHHAVMEGANDLARLAIRTCGGRRPGPKNAKGTAKWRSLSVRNPAATYSPRQSPTKYHRRRRA